MKPGLRVNITRLTLGLLLLTASAYAEAQPEGNVTQFSDPELFWQELIVGNITKVISHDQAEIVFELNNPDGSVVKGRINKNLLEDKKAKTRGSKSAVNILIIRLEENPEDKDAQKRLRSLTGQSFENPSDWRGWYDQNKAGLIWSDVDNRLVIKSNNK